MQQGQFALNAGWIWLNYFQALLNENYALTINQPMEHTASAFGLQGLFFGVTWHGDNIKHQNDTL